MCNEEKCHFCQEIFGNLDALRDHKSHRVDISNPVFKEYWNSLQTDPKLFTSEMCTFCKNKFLNSRARGGHFLSHHFESSSSLGKEGLIIKQIGSKSLEYSIDYKRFSTEYDFKNPGKFIRETMTKLEDNEGEFRLVYCTVNQLLVQVERKYLYTNSCFTTSIIQCCFDTRVKEYLFVNTKMRVLINGENGSKVFFQRFEFLKIYFSLSRPLENLTLQN